MIYVRLLNMSMMKHRFIYRSSYTTTLACGNWSGEHETRRPETFTCCPYCSSKLTKLEPDIWMGGPQNAHADPEFCTNCGWWTLSAAFVDHSSTYEWCSQTIAELVRYDITGLEIPTRLLVEYLSTHFDDIYLISPRKMEMIVQDIYRDHLNCQVELTASTRDGGKDLICVDTDNQKFLVEVKRYNRTRKVGIGIIQRFAGVLLLEGVSRGIVVTTSDYTKAALESAKKIYEKTEETLQMELKTEHDLLAWLKAINTRYNEERGIESISFVGLSLPPYCDLPESLRKAVLGIE
jgi:hypothetical protein